MSGGTRDNSKDRPQEGRAPVQQLDATIDALRSTLTEEPVPDTWRRDIAIIGVMMALFGMVAWYAAVTENAPQPVAQLHVVSTGDVESWVAPGFEQVFAAYVQAGDRLRLRHQETVPASATLNPVPAFNVGRSLGEPNWRIHVELTNRSDTLVAAITLTPVDDSDDPRQIVVSGETTALSDVAARAALQVFDWLAIDPFSVAESQAVIADIPERPEVAEPYALGLAALRRGEGRRALELLEYALEIEPQHPMLNAAVGEAYAFLGYDAQAVQQIQLAFEARESVSREKQLSIEARLRYLQGQWQEAEDLYAALIAFHPNDIDYGLALANAQHLGSRQEQAFATLSDLRSEPAFASDPRIDLVEAEFHRKIGDWEAGLVAVERAIQLAERGGLDGILARALVVYADLDGAEQDMALQRAETLFRANDDPFGTSMVLRELGDQHKAAGHLAKAAQYYHRSLEISQAVGNESEIAAAQQARAIVHDLNGELLQGYELKLAVHQSYLRRGIFLGAAVMLENIAISLFKMGRLSEASTRLDEALAEFKIHGDRIGVAWWPYHQGRILVRKGELEQARQHFTQALDNAKTSPEGYLALHTHYELAQLGLLQQREGTGSELARIAARYEQEHLMLDFGATLMLQARLAYLEKRVSEANAFLNKAVDIFQTSEADYYLALARTLQLRFGDQSVCGSLSKQIENFQHREAALLARAALERCPNLPSLRYEALAEATELGLFEATLAITAVTDPGEAKRMALGRAWTAPEYWAVY